MVEAHKRQTVTRDKQHAHTLLARIPCHDYKLMLHVCIA